MLAALSTIAPLAKMLFSTVDKAIPDKDLAEKLKAQLNTELLKSSTEQIKAAASIVEAEAKSGWFSASWRPLLMYASWICHAITSLKYLKTYSKYKN